MQFPNDNFIVHNSLDIVTFAYALWWLFCHVSGLNWTVRVRKRLIMPKHQSPKPFCSGRGFCDEQLSRQKSCVRDEVWSVAASARRRSITEIIFDRLNSRNHHFIITIQIRRHLGEISPSNAAKQHWLLQWKHRCYAIDTAQCARALMNSAKPHLYGHWRWFISSAIWGKR